MVEELRKYLYNLMSNIQGLTAIVVSDREGVPVLKVSIIDSQILLFLVTRIFFFFIVFKINLLLFMLNLLF